MKDTNLFQSQLFCDAAALAAQTPTPEQLDRLRTAFAERYLALFAQATAAFSAAAEQGQAATAARLRYQRACQRQGDAFASIAQDACGRLMASLTAEGPPITSLRELHALWIECGERAFSDAAHGEAFAAMQAELLASFVELRA